MPRVSCSSTNKNTESETSRVGHKVTERNSKLKNCPSKLSLLISTDRKQVRVQICGAVMESVRKRNAEKRTTSQAKSLKKVRITTKDEPERKKVGRPFTGRPSRLKDYDSESRRRRRVVHEQRNRKRWSMEVLLFFLLGFAIPKGHVKIKLKL